MPELGRSPGEGNDNSLQNCLGNLIDGGASHFNSSWYLQKRRQFSDSGNNKVNRHELPVTRPRLFICKIKLEARKISAKPVVIYFFGGWGGGKNLTKKKKKKKKKGKVYSLL